MNIKVKGEFFYMDKDIFFNELQSRLNEFEIKLSKEQLNRFWLFHNLLKKENKKYNLTAINKTKDIINKHFLDSAVVFSFFRKQNFKKVMDLGSGAGFPGMVYKIIFPEFPLFFLDSRMKRIIFLNKLTARLSLNKDTVKIIHGRAEEYGNKKEHREMYDPVVSRGVAPLNILCEYCMPFVEKGGLMIAYKGDSFQEELSKAGKAINELGGELVDCKRVVLPKTDIGRTIIVIKKVKRTPEKYPRRSGQPKKNPL